MTALASFLTDIGSIITSLVSNFSTILNLFTSNPVLTIPFAIFVMGACIGLTGRLKHGM